MVRPQLKLLIVLTAITATCILFDAGITLYGLSLGYHEGNPVATAAFARYGAPLGMLSENILTIVISVSAFIGYWYLNKEVGQSTKLSMELSLWSTCIPATVITCMSIQHIPAGLSWIPVLTHMVLMVMPK